MKSLPVKNSMMQALALLLLVFMQMRVSAAQQSAASSPKPEAVPAVPVRASDLSHRIEDLNSLSVAGSDLSPERPIIGEKDELPEFTREMIRVHWRDADPIDLYVIRPRGVERPPVVLYLYSYPSDGDQFKDDGYCRRVTRDGFAAVGFVSALTGSRYHSRPMKQWFVSELQESLVSSVHDVQMILDYLSTRGDLNMDRVGMLGAGSGATIAILSAAVEPRIKALDVLDPWGDWPDWMAYSARVPDAERASYRKPEFLTRIAPFDPVRWLPRLTSLPVRLEFLMDDAVTPESCKKRMESAAPHGSAQIVKYDNARALLDASSGGKHFQWIKDRLAAAAERAGSK